MFFAFTFLIRTITILILYVYLFLCLSETFYILSIFLSVYICVKFISYTCTFFLFSLKPVATWQFWKQRRYVVALLAFFGFFNIYSLRVNLSIAIVAMTEKKSITLPNGTTSYVSISKPLFTFLHFILC